MKSIFKLIGAFQSDDGVCDQDKNLAIQENDLITQIWQGLFAFYFVRQQKELLRARNISCASSHFEELVDT